MGPRRFHVIRSAVLRLSEFSDALPIFANTTFAKDTLPADAWRYGIRRYSRENDEEYPWISTGFSDQPLVLQLFLKPSCDVTVRLKL